MLSNFLNLSSKSNQLIKRKTHKVSLSLSSASEIICNQFKSIRCRSSQWRCSTKMDFLQKSYFKKKQAEWTAKIFEKYLQGSSILIKLQAFELLLHWYFSVFSGTNLELIFCRTLNTGCFRRLSLSYSKVEKLSSSVFFVCFFYWT